MSKEKPVSENPQLCPICMVKLTNYTWRRHLKDVHGWRYYVAGSDTLYPEPPKQEGGK